MTVFDLDENTGTWFEMDGGGRVQLKNLGSKDWSAIHSQTVEVVQEYKKLDGKWERFEVKKMDNDLENELFWDSLIVAWENLQDGKGQEIPCTRENKALLMLTQKRFNKFIGECIDALTAGELDRAEALEKN